MKKHKSYYLDYQKIWQQLKSKLDIIEEMRLDAKVLGGKQKKLEMQNERHEKSIASLENRSSTMEQFVRNGMADSKRQQTSIFISMGMAVFSAIVSFVICYVQIERS